MSDKTAWEGRDQQLGARIGTVWSLSRALGPAKENNYALGSLDGYIVRGCWELKRKFRMTALATGGDNDALDNFCDSVDSVVVGMGLPCCRKLDPPVAGGGGDRADH